jgi:hypothetical protein
MTTEELNPLQTIIVFLFCGILIIIVMGLLLTHEFSDTGGSLYESDEIESGSIQTYPIEFDDHVQRLEIDVGILNIEEIDMFLAAAPNQRTEDLSEMRILRSGVDRRDHIYWTVDTDEVGDGVLLLVTDNTDEGEIPATNGSIRVTTRMQMNVYPSLFSLPLTIGLIIISFVYIGLLVNHIRKKNMNKMMM